MMAAAAGRSSTSATTALTAVDNPSSKLVRDQPAMYELLAIKALDQLTTENSSQQLLTLANELVQEPTDESKLIAVLRSLSHEIGRLDLPGVVPLIRALLDVRWSLLSLATIDAYTRFLSLLSSGIPRWWPEIADKIVADFVLAPEATQPHHTVIQHILQLIPTSAPRFAGIFARHFPHYKYAGTSEMANYIANVLKVTEYAPDQRRAVWQLVVEKMVQLDVECADDNGSLSDSDSDSDSGSGSDSDSDSDSDSGLESAVDSASDTDNDDEESSQNLEKHSRKRRRITPDESESLPESSSKSTEPPESLKSDLDDASKSVDVENQVRDGEELTAAELGKTDVSIDDLSSKLDTVLSNILDYLDTQFVTSALQSGSATPLFIVLLQIFEEYVLPTHTTRAVQFILFHVAHQHPQLLESYLVSLVEVALAPDVAIDRRQKAMQYVASFVARAKGLSQQQIVSVTSFIAAWVSRYVTEREVEVDMAPSMARFRIFYAAVQTLFYIFCFRHSMLRSPDGSWVAGLDKLFQRLIITKFNPLKYCKPTVVAMFARIARVEDVAYCFSVMEQNRVGRFRVAPSPQSSLSSPVTGKKTNSNASNDNLKRLSAVFWPDRHEFAIIESFFPFDPLILKRSRKFVDDQYVEWADVAGESNSDSLTDSESDTELESTSESDYDSGSDIE